MADPNNPNGGGPPTADMLKAIQDMNSHMSQLASFTKQMTDAIASMPKVMEHTSDLAKSLKDTFVKTNEQVKDMTESIGKQVKGLKDTKEINDSIVDGIAQAVLSENDLSAAGEQTRQIFQELVDKRVEISRQYAEIAKQNVKESQDAIDRKKAIEEQIGLFGQLKKAINEAHESTARGNSSYAKSTATFAEAGFGKANMADAAGSIGSSISGLIPSAGGIGGLIGLMIAGRMEDAKFDAIGEQARQMFDRMGGAGKNFGREMGDLARRLESESMGTAQDVVALSAAFVDAGISAGEAKHHIVGFSSAIGSDFKSAALSADKALELSTGTMIRMSGTLAKDLGGSAEQAFIGLSNVGSAAMASHMNMVTFMQGVLDASSALRMLNANGAAVGSMDLSFSKQMMGGGFSKQYAQQYANAGVSQFTQGVGNMNEGIASVLGQRLGYGGGDPMAAMYGMRSGGMLGGMARGKDDDGHFKQLDPGAIAVEMFKMSKENTKSPFEQAQYLEKVFGIGRQGSEAVMAVGTESTRNGGHLSAKTLELYNNAMKTESEKTSSIDTSLKEIKNGFLNIGSGMLGMIIGSLKILIDVVLGGFHKVIGMMLMPGSEGRAKEMAMSDKYFDKMHTDISHVSSMAGKVGTGFKGLGKGFEGLAETFGGSDWFVDDAGKGERFAASLHDNGGFDNKLDGTDLLKKGAQLTYQGAMKLEQEKAKKHSHNKNFKPNGG